MAGLQVFRKKPVAIRAVQYTGRAEQRAAIGKWMSGEEYVDPLEDTGPPESMRSIEIVTSEGTMLGRPGWWVIQGVAGEFYPCDPDVFEATYTPVERGSALRIGCRCGWSPPFEVDLDDRDEAAAEIEALFGVHLMVAHGSDVVAEAEEALGG